MHKIVRNLFTLALVLTMAQSGMAQWVPQCSAAMKHDSHMSSADSGLEHAGPAQHSLRDANAKAKVPPEYADDRGCVQPKMGCDCSDCLEYFNALSLALPVIEIAPPETPRPGTHESSIITSITSIYLAPPTPPPRS